MRNRKVASKPITELGEYIARAGYETQKDFAERAGMDAPTLSLIAHKKVLPIRPMMALICSLLNIEPLQVWEAYELDLLGGYNPRGRTKRRSTLKRWRIEANLGRELYRLLKAELKKQGVTWQCWIMKKAIEEVQKCQQS